MKLINFNKLPQKKKSYGGANGNKLSVVYNKELYMLKLPSNAPKNRNISYSNSCISEYIGSHIFNMLGIAAQETLLGTFEFNKKERIAVACKDFEKNGYVLQDFASVKNQIIDSQSNGYGTELKDIMETIEKQQLTDSVKLMEHFWNIFIVDSIIGNWDRHNGNWGFLYNQEKDDILYAPIFDCGSCLFPQIDEELVAKVLTDKKELNARVYDFPTSAILENGKRINYYQFIQKHEYKDCDDAIKRIKDRFDLKAIENLIDEISCINDNQKRFFKTIIKERYRNIIENN